MPRKSFFLRKRPSVVVEAFSSVTESVAVNDSDIRGLDRPSFDTEECQAPEVKRVVPRESDSTVDPTKQDEEDDAVEQQLSQRYRGRNCIDGSGPCC
jgi:hypothetical protein